METLLSSVANHISDMSASNLLRKDHSVCIKHEYKKVK
jgi:hypothetical protein